MRIDIKKISAMAKLSLTPEEQKQYEHELANILDYMTILGEVETKNVPATCQSTGLTGQEREDHVNDTPLFHMQQELLALSRYHEKDFIKVPPIL